MSIEVEGIGSRAQYFYLVFKIIQNLTESTISYNRIEKKSLQKAFISSGTMSHELKLINFLSNLSINNNSIKPSIMLMSHLSRNQVFQLRRLRTRIIKEMLRFSYCQSISEAAYQKAVKEYPANLPKIFC